MEKKRYAVSSPNVSEREMANMALAREAAREGFVLLKNDGALPLRSKKIALYGVGARKTLKGGTGSGSVNERRSICIEEGLENAGYTVTTKAWLDDYDREYAESYAQWHDMVEKKVAGLPPNKVISVVIEQSFHCPPGSPINDRDISASDTDTAVYVIARQAGEGGDRRDAPGDYRLTDSEYAGLKKLAASYAHVVLVINVGGLVELSFLDELSGIDAVVFYTQGGMEGGGALADVLSGRHNFSGKLADTWPVKYADYPNAATFSHTNGNLEDEDYLEGVYVGYRYFDSFGVAPRYPFGFGLSYTEFAITPESVTPDRTGVTARLRVQNTGKVFSGKEVAQLYLSCPRSGLKKEAQRLVGFAKTRELAPGEAQVLSVGFDMLQAASYDEEQSVWVLEKGDYILKAGNSSANTKIIAVIALDETVVVERCGHCCAPETPVRELDAPSLNAPAVDADTPRIALNAADFTVVTHDYTEPPVTETEHEKELLDSLSPEEMAELLRGGDLRQGGRHVVLGAGGKTAIALAEKGIGNIVLSDGPAGLNILHCVKFTENGVQTPGAVIERFSFGAMGEQMKAMTGGGGTPYYRYATAWPVHLLLAQTWNEELVERVGRAEGVEMLEFGVTVWLAPALNIHRNPLCGRNFEYFSEDPLLSGKMAAAVTRGVQSHKGIGVTLKHFACNNQEDNRTGVSSNVNERALREIYLKGFEIAVKESGPLAVMTSYNRLNKVYTANSYDLCTLLLRCEWGFKGFVMSDWGSCDPGHGRPELGAQAGNDLIMPGTENDREAILAAVKQGAITQDMLRRAACRVLRVILQSEIYAET
jgi:beta-glucosidase